VAETVPPSVVAVRVTVVVVVTAVVVTVKTPLVAPGSTYAGPALAAVGSLLVIVTGSKLIPGAGLASVTVPVVPLAPLVVEGLKLSETGASTGSISSWLVRVLLLQVAVNVTTVTALTAAVGTLTETRYSPAGISTVAGTGASEGELLVRLTSAPPAGAGPLRSGSRLTVPPPSTSLLGPISREKSDTGVTVTVVEADDEPSVAVNVTDVGVLTVPAV
jgi:hypothetical protein